RSIRNVTQKDPTFQSFIDIYKISNSATEFASNFEQHLSSCTINIPFCPSRPMIPVMLRIYAFWPRSRADTLGVDLTCKALEGIMIAAILIWLFSGCIWIYGPGQNINIYFQPYHCDNFVYWTAFISVILIIHSMIILFAILLCFCLLCVGLLRDNKP
ncbi:Uncharacterized protein BM_BM3986, partial [Brugia malayi]|uniref:Bm3986 n=1 Tax=Brugia malayi TaxID=6279 RepID=A0A0K0JCP3_BRUMA